MPNPLDQGNTREDNEGLKARLLTKSAGVEHGGTRGVPCFPGNLLGDMPNSPSNSHISLPLSLALLPVSLIDS